MQTLPLYSFRNKSFDFVKVIYSVMRTMKTFEEFWPFSKKSKTILEINEKKIKDLPLYLKDGKIGSNVLGLTVTRYDVGYSKMNPNKLIVEFTDSTNHQSLASLIFF